MRLLKTKNGLDLDHSSLWKKKSFPQISDRIRMLWTETLQLPEGSLSYRHRQVRKARRKKTLNFRFGSSLK
jgi:hypothetical protein